MKAKFSSFFLPLLFLVFAQTLIGSTKPETLVLRAVSENSADSAPAIAELRELGPAGVDLLFKTYAREINEQVANPLLPATPEWQRLSAALDAVAQQKNSYLSGLYWYTDLEQAKAAARASGKPILSLHLLGKLSDEYSCANSRFFRTVLYSNAEVSKMLRERFILHWQSERPAPRVTIDFGDGRKLERTLTGNSIHYVLDADGQVIDALPGLYAPAAFLRSLYQMWADFKNPTLFAKNPQTTFPQPYLRARLNAIKIAWFADIQRAGGKIPAGTVFVELGPEGAPTALAAASGAMTKMITEVNILRATTRVPVNLGQITDADTWNRIAQLHQAEAQLDSRSQGLILRQNRDLLVNDARKYNAFVALVNRLQQSIALDTVRNEYLMHAKLYEWLLADKERDVSKLNKKVYSELFLTPASDPWLGLYSPDVYTALDGGGLSRN
jgi:hypothetical protein